MPWWAIGYLLALLGIGVWGAVDDAREGRGRGWIALDATTTAAWIYFIAAYYHPAIAEPLGRWLAPLFLANLAATGVSTHQEIVVLHRNPDPTLSARANFVGDLVGIVLGTALLAPAVALGALVASRAWS